MHTQPMTFERRAELLARADVHSRRFDEIARSHIGTRWAPEIKTPAPFREPDFALSPREREVLQLLADGFRNMSIASRLGLSLETVKSHVKSVISKTGACNRAGAVGTAMRAHVIE